VGLDFGLSRAGRRVRVRIPLFLAWVRGRPESSFFFTRHIHVSLSLYSVVSVVSVVSAQGYRRLAILAIRRGTEMSGAAVMKETYYTTYGVSDRGPSRHDLTFY